MTDYPLTCPEATFEGVSTVAIAPPPPGEPSLGLFSADSGTNLLAACDERGTTAGDSRWSVDLWDGKPIVVGRVVRGASGFPGWQGRL